ncbi:ABC transporter substrate-binding protein [Acuticoccus sp.]|uniref:ABC transporter substrate-binding protein n=1 Tax=Acuticoccus sp. TaxID=1904378 RepID=UPI003B52EAE9
MLTKGLLHGTIGAAITAIAWVDAPTPALAQDQTELRVGMTAADIPLTVGQPDNGFEGFRFMGYTLYDSLINWDLSQADAPSKLMPGLATSWTVDPEDATKWTMELREDVTFHDGSPFNADAVIWNYDKILNEDAPQYDPRQVSLVAFRVPSVASYRKVDDMTVEFTTHEPDSFFPFQVSYILMASPAHWEALGGSWEAFADDPSGTGPWKLEELVPRERAVLVPNTEYWDEERVPEVDRLVLLPIPEPTARTAALLSGQVDWIEAPSPDAIPRIEGAGFEVVSNQYPHIWPYHLSRVEGSPWNDINVRKAANLAIDREGILALLGGYAVAAKGHVSESDPWFGAPSFDISFDPERAKELLAEAGHGPDNPVEAKILISASGSGQMMPLPMNEYIQQNLADVGINVDFEVMEWQSLLDRWRAGAKDEASLGGDAINVSYTTQDPFSAFTRLVKSDLHAPNGVNWGYFVDPEVDALLKEAQESATDAERDETLARLHTKLVDDAAFLWVVHDVAPRAIAPKVEGFVQARNWFQDLTPVTIAE